MNLKKFLKLLRKNESTVSMIFGLLVILFVGFFIINNFNKQDDGETIPSIGTEQSENIEGKYVVQEGDDLWKIAEKKLGSGFEWNKIADLNNLKDPYVIEKGQELKLPTTETTTTPVVLETPSVTPQVTEAELLITEAPSVKSDSTIISDNTYEVVKGDTLWSISVRAYGDGYRWMEIAQANNLENPNVIHSGNRFVIPR